MAKNAMTTEPTTETTPAPAPGPAAPAAPPTPRASDANWSGPVDRLAVGAVPAKAMNLNVEGRRLVGPVQGFGQLWQKRYRDPPRRRRRDARSR